MVDIREFIRARLDETDAIWKSISHDVDNVCDHIARHDPDRVLVEVKSKRMILEEIERQLGDDPTDETANWLARVLAAPFREHPDFDPSWEAT